MVGVSWWRRFGLLVVTVVLAGLASPAGMAWAQSAEEAFKKGLAKFDDGDCETALPLFETAYEGTQSPNARLYVARCLVKLGRDVEAYEEMAGTLAIAREKAETEAKYAKTRDAAAAELAQLEPKVGKVVVAFDEAYEGAVIMLDGEEVSEAKQGRAHRRRARRHPDHRAGPRQEGAHRDRVGRRWRNQSGGHRPRGRGGDRPRAR